MMYKKPISIQKKNLETEEWETYIEIAHANVNKSSRDSEFLNAGAIQSKSSKVFSLRYRPKLKEIDGNTQLYRVVFENRNYNIVDYDDFQERHKEVKLLGVS